MFCDYFKLICVKLNVFAYDCYLWSFPVFLLFFFLFALYLLSLLLSRPIASYYHINMLSQIILNKNKHKYRSMNKKKEMWGCCGNWTLNEKARNNGSIPGFSTNEPMTVDTSFNLSEPQFPELLSKGGGLETL